MNLFCIYYHSKLRIISSTALPHLRKIRNSNNKLHPGANTFLFDYCNRSIKNINMKVCYRRDECRKMELLIRKLKR